MSWSETKSHWFSLHLLTSINISFLSPPDHPPRGRSLKETKTERYSQRVWLFHSPTLWGTSFAFLSFLVAGGGKWPGFVNGIPQSSSGRKSPRLFVGGLYLSPCTSLACVCERRDTEKFRKFSTSNTFPLDTCTCYYDTKVVSLSARFTERWANEMHCFPTAGVTNFHKCGGLKEYKCILL